MSVQDLNQALNQIHLEVSVVETLLCQFRVGACEANIKLLTRVIQANADYDDISENWCLEKLGDLLDNYVLICHEIVENPKLMLSYPFIYSDVFNVLLRTVYKYCSAEEFESVLIATAKMMVAADDYLTEKEFTCFIYWFDALAETEAVWKEVVNIPRIQKMAKEEESQALQKQISFYQNKGGNLAEA